MPEEGAPASNAGVGVIYPPPDIRGVIDKTAQFVAKCGPEFEQRVLREQNVTKFSFLLPSNPFRPYYELKVKEFKTGVVEEKQPEVPQAVIDAKAKEDEKKKKKEQLKMLTDGKKKKVAKEPPADQFTVSHPFIAPMDMDIIKLTAQFVARNGQKFLIGLTQRESRNPQFDFLKPTHALFGYFTSLVDAYTKCLMPNKEEVEKLRKCCNAPSEILDKAILRFNWDEQQDGLRANKEEEEKEEKEQMGIIDWHDFVVVESIEFTAEDEKIPLAAPLDTSTGAPHGAPVPLEGGKAGILASAAQIEIPKGVEEEEREEAAAQAEKEREERQRKETENKREREERERKEKEAKDKEDKEREEQEKAALEQKEMEVDEEPAELEPEIPLPPMDPEMKVRKDYVRHKKAAAARLMQRCPITGQLIPAEEMSNHLRILLLDPKWKQQKDQLVERARKESAFADDVEANLAGFVAKRPDLFGSVEEQIREAEVAGAEAAARDAGADAGPAHTMVPASTALEKSKQEALTRGSGSSAGAGGAAALGNLAAGLGALSVPQMPGPPTAGPVPGMSTINARLTPMPQNLAATAGAAGAAYGGEDEDDEDEPDTKKPRTDDGSLQPENAWITKFPQPIRITIEVDLGPEAAAAGVPSSIPIDVTVRTRVLDMKHMLASKVEGATVTPAMMKLKVGTGHVLKDSNSLAFYNVAPGSVIHLERKQRGGKR